ncbi:MAG: type II toxin-antitoxin system PemK/MazF family toxin [Leptospira sp.]|nr:type II toxin-antitoxin system PemK/MazF family toxin [Leptospira sp.]
MTFKQFDVVSVPFPFTDKNSSKRRPALVLSDEKSFNSIAGQSILAMITSALHTSWPLDIQIKDLKSAGLPTASVVRMKLFTLDHFLVIRLAGHLSATDEREVQKTLKKLLNN